MAIVSRSRKFRPLSSDRRFAGWTDGVSWGYRPLIGVKPVSIGRVIPLLTLRDFEVLKLPSFWLFFTKATLHPRNCTFIGLVSPHLVSPHASSTHICIKNLPIRETTTTLIKNIWKIKNLSNFLFIRQTNWGQMCKINKTWLLWDFGIFYQHNYLCPFAPLASWLAGIHCVARLKINALAAAEFRSKPGKHLNWFLLLCWTS